MSMISSSNLSVMSVNSVSLKLTDFPSFIAKNGTTGCEVAVFSGSLTFKTPNATYFLILATMSFISLQPSIIKYVAGGRLL